MYFKIYGSYFLQSPLCFFMDVIMSKNKGVFHVKTSSFYNSQKLLLFRYIGKPKIQGIYFEI